jgi:hypothetical protein
MCNKIKRRTERAQGAMDQTKKEGEGLWDKTVHGGQNAWEKTKEVAKDVKDTVVEKVELAKNYVTGTNVDQRNVQGTDVNRDLNRDVNRDVNRDNRNNK